MLNVLQVPRSNQNPYNPTEAGVIGISIVCVLLVVLSIGFVFLLSCYEECFVQPKKGIKDLWCQASQLGSRVCCLIWPLRLEYWFRQILLI